MSQGIYSAAAGMAADQARLDALANDLANVNTTGYKTERLGFRDLVYAQEGQHVETGSGAAVVDAGRDFQEGSITPSDNPLALAIDGSGFFRVKREDGSLALTRAGDLQLDAQRRLTTPNGELLDPPITLPAGTSPSDVKVAANGAVTVNGAQIGTIQIVDVPAPTGLQSVGDSLFVPTTVSGQPSAARGSTVQQGVLESSNVDVASAMTDLIDAQRSYQMTARVISTQDQLMQIANDIRH
jgi:flagellar basal-body rod protein FlgG